MSVAFRREGDDEHLEPKFEIPIPPGPNLVTPRGLGLIGQNLVELEALLATSPADAETTNTALQRDLRYWQTRQITAELVPPPAGATVEIGTTVTFRLAGKTRALAIVGYDEAEPAAGSVAFSAPLARALLGAEPGERVAFNGKDDAIEVLAIEVSA